MTSRPFEFSTPDVESRTWRACVRNKRSRRMALLLSDGSLSLAHCLKREVTQKRCAAEEENGVS